MYCPSCLKTVDSSSSKCPGCGKPVGERNAPAAAPAGPGQGRSGGAAPATRSYRRFLTGAGLFGVAALLGRGAGASHGAPQLTRHHYHRSDTVATSPAPALNDGERSQPGAAAMMAPAGSWLAGSGPGAAVAGPTTSGATGAAATVVAPSAGMGRSLT